MYTGSRVEELFAKKAKVTVVMNGGETWHGIEGVRRCFGSLDEVHATQPGRMGSIMALQPLITFAKNGKTANGQWFLIGPAVLPTRNDAKDKEHLEAMWMFGRYNIDYVKEDGVWLFKKFGVELHFLSSVTKGWVESPFPFAVRTFESEEGTKPEGTGTFPHLYRPNGPNDYGPAPPEAKHSNSQ
jgi:hypothetical protein